MEFFAIKVINYFTFKIRDTPEIRPEIKGKPKCLGHGHSPSVCRYV